MAQYLPLPDGSVVTVREGETPDAAWARAQQEYPEAFGFAPAAAPAEQPKGGFGAAFKSGVQKVIGQGALTAGKAGLIDTKRAEQIAQEREARANQIFKPTDEPFIDAPVQNTLEMLGGSAPYMLAPLAAGAGAAVAGAPLAVGAGAAGLASLAQFTGSNLERQMGTGKTLEQASGQQAVAAAVPQAALDVIGFRFIPGIGRLFGAAGEKITVDTARQMAAQTARQIAADYAKKTGQAMTAEGLTEAMQQVLERAQAELKLTDPEARGEYLQSLMGGALLGGVMAGPGNFVDRSSAVSKSKQLQVEEQKKANLAKQAAEKAVVDSRMAAEADPAQMGPKFVQPEQQQIPGVEGELRSVAPVKPLDPAEVQQRGSKLLEERRVLEQRLEESQGAIGEANATRDFDSAQKALDMFRRTKDSVAAIDEELKTLGVSDTAADQQELVKQIDKLERKLAAQTGPGVDPDAVAKLLSQRSELQSKLRDVGGAQGELDLGKPRELTDPAETYRYQQEQQARDEFGQRNELLAAQRPAADDTRMDLFNESTAQVEDVRQNGEPNLDYLDETFTKALDRPEGPIPVPASVQPIPNAERMLEQINALETARTSGASKQRQQALREFAQLTGPEGPPFMQELAAARQQQAEALQAIEGRLDRLRSGETPGKAYALRASDNRLATQAKKAYVDAALREAALVRRATNAPAMTTDEALAAASEIDTALEELLTRGQAMPIRDALIFDRQAEPSFDLQLVQAGVRNAEQQVLRARQALRALQEAQRNPATEAAQVQAERDLAARMLDVEAAKRELANAPRELVEGEAKLRKGDPRDLDQRPFAKYRSALGNILEQVQQARDRAARPKVQAKADKQLLRRQDAKAEAARVSEAAGDTAQTLEGEKRRSLDYLDQQLSRLEQSGRNVDMLRGPLEKFPTRDVRAAVREIADRLVSGQAIDPALRRQLSDAVSAARAATSEQPGQLDIFDTGSARAEQRDVQQRMQEIDAELASQPTRFKNGKAAAQALERHNILQAAKEQMQKRLAGAQETEQVLQAEGQRVRGDAAFTRVTPANFQRALDTSPEVKKARAVLERVKKLAQVGFATNTAPDSKANALEKKLAVQLRAPGVRRESGNEFMYQAGWASDPEIQRAFDAVEQQRAVLAKSIQLAVGEAVAADQKARDVVYSPLLKTLRTQIKEAQNELDKLTSWPYADADGTPSQPELVKQLTEQLRDAQSRLALAAQGAVAKADSTMRAFAFAEDAAVQFEKAVLADLETALQQTIEANAPNIVEQRQAAQAAQAQRARVAAAEAAQRAATEAATARRLQLEQRLRSGLGLPALKPEDRAGQAGLRQRIAAFDAALATPDAAVDAVQQELVTLESTPDPDKKIKRKIYDKRRQLEKLQDAAGATRERLEGQRQELMNRLDAHQYLTEQQRAEDAARAQAERERGTALDALAAQPFAPRRRATSPVYRDSSQEPRSLRTGSAESMAGDNTPLPKGLRPKESRKIRERNVEITANEMQIANAEAERLRSMTPAARKKQVAEAQALAKELKRQETAALKASRTASAIDEMDADFDADTSDSGLDFGGMDDALLREDSTFYAERASTPLSDAATGEAKAGQLDTLLERLQSEGSTPFVREVVARLRPLLANTTLQVLPEVRDAAGARVEGAFIPQRNVVLLDALALDEEVIVHETTHAVTLAALEAPPTSLSAEQQQARQDLEQLFDEVRGDPTFATEYASKNLAEFAAELMSNQQVRDRLDQRGNWLQRFYQGVLKLLGLRAATSEKAVADVYKLFQPSRQMESRYSGVNSVLRGTFPGTAAEFNADIPESVRNTTQRIVGRDLTLVDKLQAHLAGFRTAYIDRFDGIDKALRQGVARGLIPQLQAFQTQYFLRYGEHRNQFVEQAARDGVPQMLKHDDGTFTIETPDGDHANLTKIAKILHGANVGNEQATEQLFTQYLAVLRAEQDGVGYDKLNFSAPLTAAEAAEIKRTVAADPARKQAFESARTMYREYNHKLLDFMQQTGALSRTETTRLKSKEYVPYYRNRAGIVELVVGSEQPVRIGNIVDQPYLKELVGGDEKILPFFTGAMQNTSMLIDMGLRNQQTKDTAMTLHKMGVATIGNGDGPTDMRDIVRFKVDGERKFARIENSIEEFGVNADLLVKGMEGIKTTLPAFLRALQIPANVLRKAVTRAPAYAVRQIIREPINAWLTSGGNFTPVVSSVKELASMVRGTSEKELTLQRAGAVSSNVITGDIQDQVRILRDISDGKTTFDKVMSVADKFALQGDTATRAVLYDTYRKEGMTHMQALLGSLESMNFARRGVSPSMQMMSMLIPFFNAQVQGMDVIYRALRGQSTLEQQMDVRRKLLKRGALVAAATMAYAAAMQDDEAYKNATDQQRALNWFMPLPGLDEPLRVPIPFELGYLFKVLPETVINVAFGDESVGDAAKAFAGLLHQTVPFGIPQAVKPAIEVATNHSFFTDTAVEAGRERGMQPAERMRENTTELAKLLGKAGLLSPIQIDYLIRGYTGGLGLTIASIPNFALRPLNTADSIEQPERLLSQMPLLGPLFQPVDGRAAIDAAYDEIENWQQAHNTFQGMIASGRRADAQQFAQDYSRQIALNSTGGAFRQQMGDLAKLRRAVAAGPGTPAEKRARIDEIKQIEIALARRVEQLAGAGG